MMTTVAYVACHLTGAVQTASCLETTALLVGELLSINYVVTFYVPKFSV